MIKLSWIKKDSNLLEECFSFFDVGGVKEWELKYKDYLCNTSFRTSNTYKSSIGSVSAWLRQGELLSKTIDCKPYNELKFEKELYKIRSLTRVKKPVDFVPQLVEICAKCGVALVFLMSLSGCKASGATKFLGKKKAMILMSFRYLSDDHFWFTFFHEAGHILMHEKKSVFIEELKSSLDSQEERDANNFAGEMLIPYKLQSQLKYIKGKRKIIQFAMDADISPGIVVGQLQHRGQISFNSLNSYKRRYSWATDLEFINDLYRN